MSLISAKRFWTQASTVPAPGGFAVHLDARPLRTPAKAPLVVPVAPWADAIAAEWDAQGEIIEPTSMPFTQMANVAIDRVGLQRAEVAEMLAAYGASDLLCYRADQPQGLVARQTDQWNPWLEWAKTTLDAPLRSTAGIVPIDQPKDSLARLSAQVDAFDPFALTAFHDLVTLSGSLVLALATADGALDAPKAWALSRVDEDWQIAQWGEDAEARDMASRKEAAFLRSAQVTHWLKERP